MKETFSLSIKLGSAHMTSCTDIAHTLRHLADGDFQRAMRQVRQYGFAGLAGCVQQTRARQTGSLVGVYLEVITPNLEWINTSLGQDNDARYLAYVVVWAMGEAARASS